MSKYPQIDAVEAKIHENRAAFAASAARINANTDYTPEARQRRIKEEHFAAAERHQTLFNQHRALKAKIAEELRVRAFGAGGSGWAATEAERIATRSAYSAAIDRASQAERPTDLKRLLSVARTARDDLLASAVAAVAHERGARDVLDDFLGDHPQKRESIEEYEAFTAGRGHARSSLEDRLRLSGPALPRETL